MCLYKYVILFFIFLVLTRQLSPTRQCSVRCSCCEDGSIWDIEEAIVVQRLVISKALSDSVERNRCCGKETVHSAHNSWSSCCKFVRDGTETIVCSSQFLIRKLWRRAVDIFHGRWKAAQLFRFTSLDGTDFIRQLLRIKAITNNCLSTIIMLPSQPQPKPC